MAAMPPSRELGKAAMVQLFGREVRRRRESLGLSLADFASRTGLTANFIGTIELGKRDPSLSTVLAIARAFEAPPGELLSDAHGLAPAGLEVARLFDAGPKVIQETLLPFLRSVVAASRQGRELILPTSTVLQKTSLEGSDNEDGHACDQEEDRA